MADGFCEKHIVQLFLALTEMSVPNVSRLVYESFVWFRLQGLFEWGSVILEYEMKEIKAVLDDPETNEDEERDDQLVQLVLQSLVQLVTEEPAVGELLVGEEPILSGN